jgi:competence ComEA-like helix-hairpin-helix protein
VGKNEPAADETISQSTAQTGLQDSIVTSQLDSRQRIRSMPVVLTLLSLFFVATLWRALHRTVWLDDPKRTAAQMQTILPGMQINLNTADATELALLPAVGAGLAERIISYREQHGPFKSIDELRHVSGIGPAIMERVRPYVSISEHDATGTPSGAD